MYKISFTSAGGGKEELLPNRPFVDTHWVYAEFLLLLPAGLMEADVARRSLGFPNSIKED